MTEISSVGEDVAVLGVLEVEQEETFDDLCSKASEAIANENFDRAIQIMAQLDKTSFDNFQSKTFESLFKSLWKKDASQGDRLVDLVSNNFTFSLEKDRVKYEACTGGRGCFTVQRELSDKGVKHLQEAYSFFVQGDQKRFEESLETAFQLIETRDISERDLMSFLIDCSAINIVALEKSFPIISNYFQVSLEGNVLSIAADYCSQSLRSDLYLPEPLKAIVGEVEQLIEGQEKWDIFMGLTSFKVEASLIEQNKTDFDLHLSTMKAHLPKISDPGERLDWIKDIESMESMGNELFGFNALAMQAEKV